MSLAQASPELELEQDQNPQHRHHARLLSTAVICAYFLLAICAYWPVLGDLGGKSGGYRDFIQSVWFITWAQHALVHGLNPFFSSAMYAPTGVNLAENTASPLLALLTAPLALIVNPLAIGNLLMVIGMPVTATAAYAVLRKWQLWWPAAAIGGLAYGFSPYMLGQGIAHPELLFVPLPPLIVMTVVSIIQDRGGRRRLGIQLGLLVAAQYLISPEVLVTVLLLLFLGIVFVAIRHFSKVPGRVRTAALPVAIALGLGLALLAYPLWFMFEGSQHFTGPTFPLENPYHYDLLAFIYHGPLQRISLGLHVHSGYVTPRDAVEEGAYIGIPLLIVTGFLAWRSRRSPRMQLSFALLITSMVLSLGPYLSINGPLTHIPLPFLLLGHIPLVDNVLPSRISLEVGACLAAILAFGIDDLHRTGLWTRQRQSQRDRTGPDRGVIVITALVLVVMIITQLPRWPYPTKRAVALPSAIDRAVPSGDPVAITYPYAVGPKSEVPLLWQAEDGFRFRITGGYGHHPTSSGRAAKNPTASTRLPPLEKFLMALQKTGPHHYKPIVKEISATRDMISQYDVRLVVVDRSIRGGPEVVELFERVLGPPNATSGSFFLWVTHRQSGEH